MSGGRIRTALAILFAAVGEVLGLAAIVYLFVPLRPGAQPADVAPFEVVFAGIFLLGCPLLGAIVAIHRPDNVTGWLFQQFALWMGFGFAADGYVRHAPPVATTAWIGVLGSSLSALGFCALFLLLMLFPTNRLPSRRWIVLPIVEVVSVGLTIASSLFAPDADVKPPVAGLVNPIGQPPWAPALETANEIGSIGMAAVVLGSAVLLAIRLRRAQGIEREQLKWFAWAAGVVASLLAASVVADAVAPAVSDLSWSIALSSMALLPAAAAIAVLRHRLFDIDLLINRTLVYIGLTVVLAAAYAVSVLVLTELLAPLVPGNSLAVAGSTLVVAALFSPARRRVQAVVDRRFYRERYSASREIARFAATLRDDVEIERVKALLATTVDRTVQPMSASIWIRGGEE